MDFAHAETVVDGVPVVQVRGDVDMHSLVEFRSTLLAAVSSAPGALVVDMSAVTFFDSTGLHGLDEVYADAEERGTRIILANLTEQLRRLLEITGLDTRFTGYPTITEAVSAANG